MFLGMHRPWIQADHDPLLIHLPVLDVMYLMQEHHQVETTTAVNQDPFTGGGRYVPNGDNDQPRRPLSASQSSVISMTYFIPSSCIYIFPCLETEKDAELTIAFPQTHYIIMGNADTLKILSKLERI